MPFGTMSFKHGGASLSSIFMRIMYLDLELNEVSSLATLGLLTPILRIHFDIKGTHMTYAQSS